MKQFISKPKTFIFPSIWFSHFDAVLHCNLHFDRVSQLGEIQDYFNSLINILYSSSSSSGSLRNVSNLKRSFSIVSISSLSF
jgi:hypothetical protein